MLKAMILLGLALCSIGFVAEAMREQPNDVQVHGEVTEKHSSEPEPDHAHLAGDQSTQPNTNHPPAGPTNLAKLRLLGVAEGKVGRKEVLSEIDPESVRGQRLSPVVRSPASPGRSPLSWQSAGDGDGQGGHRHHHGFNQIVDENEAVAIAVLHHDKRLHLNNSDPLHHPAAAETEGHKEVEKGVKQSKNEVKKNSNLYEHMNPLDAWMWQNGLHKQED